jgi:hypothetical protein
VTKRETGEEGEGREAAQAFFICIEKVRKESVIVVERSMADIVKGFLASSRVKRLTKL